MEAKKMEEEGFWWGGVNQTSSLNVCGVWVWVYFGRGVAYKGKEASSSSRPKYTHTHADVTHTHIHTHIRMPRLMGGSGGVGWWYLPRAYVCANKRPRGTCNLRTGPPGDNTSSRSWVSIPPAPVRGTAVSEVQ